MKNKKENIGTAMNVKRLPLVIALCLCVSVIGILIHVKVNAKDNTQPPDVEILKKIATQSIKKALETTQDIEKAASIVGIGKKELERVCIALDINIPGVQPEIPPIPVTTAKKIERIEKESDAVLINNSSTPYVLLVEKSSHSLFLVKFEKGSQKIIATYECKTGKNHGDKKTQGDNKTPEGVYFLTAKYKRKEIANAVGKKNAYQYGELVFVTDFPNALDAFKGKKGSGIWLHGTDEKFDETDSNDTRGCVVTTNKTIQELDRYIVPGKTPLIITSSLNFIENGTLENQRQDAMHFIESWKTAWEQKNIDEYMNHYSKSFNTRGWSYTAWKNDKMGKWNRNQRLRITLADISIFKHDSGLVAHFRQQYSIVDANNTALLTLSGIKTIYIIPENNTWKIVTEDID